MTSNFQTRTLEILIRPLTDREKGDNGFLLNAGFLL
jgi:hypothetical protein